LKLETDVSPWPHRLAVLLCVATFPLVWVGGLVTTTEAGMAFSDWPTSGGHFLFFYPWLDWLRGPWDMFVEHGHRMLAAVVGVLTILFFISLWITAQPKWLRVLGIVAVIGVIAQCVLGGMRVLLDERTLAMIHACVGPAFFAFTAVLALLTSRHWRESGNTVDIGSSNVLPVMAIVTPALAYLQLAVGAHVRHYSPTGSYPMFRYFVLFHVALGISLALQILITTIMFWRKAPQAKPLVAKATVLTLLVVVQLALGAATWVVKYGWPAFMSDTEMAADFTVQANGWRQMQITTAHVANGSLILAISTCLAVLSKRMFNSQPRIVSGDNARTSLSGMVA
jgi:cytochrome c oxidase assembly protein subunit 15